MTKEIKYIGFYDLPDIHQKRVSTIAAINKMDYICNAINQAGYSVHIISPSWFKDDNDKIGYKPKKTFQLNTRKRITFCPSFSTKSKWSRNLKIIFTLSWLFLWLVLHVRRHEKILVYHVQWLSLPIRWAKKIKGFKLVLEVEEIYGQVWQNKNILNNWERKLIKDSDYFIAVSDVLAKILGDRVKAIVYGNYTISDSENTHLNQNLINIIYAGSIDYTKGGAYNAVRCAAFLPDHYIVHICGPGSESDTKDLLQHISVVNEIAGKERCKYHGVLTENEISNLLLSCQIAINPQKSGANMLTLFPSKIIKYLSYNLRVISTRIPSIENSAVSELIYFTEDDRPETFARLIQSVDLNLNYNSKSLIMNLDEDFVDQIKNLF